MHRWIRHSGLGIGLSLGVICSNPALGITTFSNGVYEVHVADGTDFSIGSWNAFTGPAHPTGADNDLLFSESGGFTSQSTNFSSLRVFDPAGNRDYTFGDRGAVDMDPLLVSSGPSSFGAVGNSMTWGISAEALTVTQDLVITGTTFSDSAIYHTVEVSNDGANPISIGWRNLYDWQVDDPTTDDGPNNSIEDSTGGVSTTLVAPTTTEFVHVPDAGDLARVSVDPGEATYEPLLAIGFDPGFIPVLPVSVPDEYAYASWPFSVGTSFDYVIGPSDVTSDSAGLSWFGRDAARAITIDPDSSVRFTQVIFGVEPDTGPPGGDPIPEPVTGLLSVFSLAALGFGTCRRRVD